ncbi:MAG: SprB repeat-containing protein, partial [Bacteroidetes bacterium]|nr:SprB repeat-containing protein [Bacteroidota bacterium]MBU1718795.1 SprB repeat-containing protein [Bacteroidota bacterium]
MEIFYTTSKTKSSSMLLSFFSVLFLFSFGGKALAADYFWVNGPGNWSDFGSHWATTSGGATFHLSVPGVDDDVYFDANSFPLPLMGQAVTVDFQSYCRNIDWTGVTNTPDLAGNSWLEIYGSLTFVPGMTATFNGMTSFKSPDPGNTIDFSTVVLNLNSIEFDGAGEWTLLSDLDMSAVGFGNFNFIKGTFYTNDKNITTGWFSSWANNARTLHFGNSVITCQNIQLNNPTTLTFDAGTSTIIIENSWFDGQNLTYYDVTFDPSWPNDVFFMGSNTFHKLSFDSPNATGIIFPAGGTQTLFDIDFGATCSKRKNIMSSTTGTQATIKKISGTVQEDNLNIKDIKIIGGASFITDNGINLGNVTNWTINEAAPTTLYWVGGTGSWNDTDHWSTTSGGAYPSGYTCVPTSTIDVVFDANSFSGPGQILTINDWAMVNSMTWTGVTNNPTVDAAWPTSLCIFGSLTFDAAMTFNYGNTIMFMSDAAGNTITSAGININAPISFEGSGEWTLQDNLSCGSVSLNQGTLVTNDKNLLISGFSANSDKTRHLDLGSTNITCSGNWSVSTSTNMTMDAGTSTIFLQGSLWGGGLTYNDVVFTSSYMSYIYESNTFADLTNSGGGDLIIEAGTTQNFTSFAATGSCSKLVQIRSNVAGEIATLNQAAGSVDLDYVSVKDITASGGATFNATNSFDGGNNTGWNFVLLASTDYYWIGGAGNWNDPANWSLTSGGVANPGGCIPTQVDNVFFDAGSALGNQTVTMNVAGYCNNMDWTGVALNARLSGTYELHVYGSYTLAANMIMSHTGSLYFNSTSAGNNINTNGKSLLGDVYFSGSGDWTLQNNFTVSNSRSIYFNEGSLITNNRNVSTRYFYSYTDDNRTLTLGSSTITVEYWYFSDGTNLTIVPNTSTITVTTNGYFYGGDAAYNTVNINPAGYVYIYGSNSFNTLNVPNCSSLLFFGGTTTTFNTLTIPNGVDCNNYFSIGTNPEGSVANLSMPAGIFTGNWLRISNLTAGGGGTFNALNSQGIGNVTGWNIVSAPGVDLYWVGDGGNWNDPNHWSLTSGGAPYGCLPSTNDNVYFDASSFTLGGQQVNINSNAACKNMDWTGVTNSPEFVGGSTLTINGSLTLVPAMLMNYWGTMNFASSAPANTILSAGQMLTNVSIAGNYTLLDDLNFNWGNLIFNSGIFTTDDFDINNSGGYFSTNSTTARTLNLGASHISVYAWQVQDPTNLTINAGTSEITIVQDGWEFRGGGMVYNDVTIYKNSWSTIPIFGSNTFSTLYIKPGADIGFEEGTVQTTSNFVANGNSGSKISLKSYTPGSTAEINQTLQEFCGDYLNIKDMIASGTTFYAGESSTNLGNNTGWTWSGVTAIDQYPAPMCEDTEGGGIVDCIDLTSYNNAIDGGSGYTHIWYEDAGLTTPVATPANVTVSDGEIFYDAVDNGTCINVAEITFTVLPLPVLSFATTDVGCFGETTGAIDMTVTVATAPFTFLWDNGETTEDIDTLVAGTYTVEVTDANGCVNNGLEDVLQPLAALSASTTKIDVKCFGELTGSIDLTVAGGTGPFTFLWDNAETTEDIDTLAAGTYSVTVTDANSCEFLTSETISQPLAALTASTTKIDVKCFGELTGSIDLTVADGTGPYTFLWDNAETTEDIDTLASGTYSVTVTDANSCEFLTSETISQPLAALTASTTKIDVKCFGELTGSIDLTVADGTGPYTFLWDNAETTEDIDTLAAGTYSVTVTDANSCEFLTSETISQPLAALTASTTKIDVKCFGELTGSIDLTVAGGTGPYTFLWDNAETTEDIDTLAAGTYSVTVTD